MLPFATKSRLIFLVSTLSLLFSLLFSLQLNPVPLNSVHAQEEGYCENGWTFNGGDAGDDDNWEYTGCGGGDEDDDGDRDRWWEDDDNGNDNDKDEEDDDNTSYCDDESWTNEETDGSYWCDNGRICFEQWRRDESCNISRDGEDCREDARCQEESDNEDDSCPYVKQYPECHADGQVYEAWQNCRGEWDPRPTGQSCDAGGDDEEENQGGCGANQYWDTETGQCAVNDLTQTQENDAIYCRDQCGGSCAGDLGAKYCTNPEGGRVYDCNNPDDQWVAECQNQLGEEFQHIGIDPGAGAGDLAQCGFADLDGGECRGAEFCKTHILYCGGEVAGNPEVGGNCNLVPGLCGVGADENGNLVIERPACNPECGSNERCMDDGNGAGFCQALENIPANPSDPCEADSNSSACQAARGEQAQIESFQNGCENRSGEYYTECNWKTHSVQAVCSYSGQYDTKDLGQQGGVCNAPSEVGNKAYCANVNCGSGFHCEVSSSNVAECKPDYGDDGQPVVSQENTSKPAVQAPAEIPARCRDIINPDRLDECIQREAGQTPGGGQSDATCQAQTPDENYCDGNVCIQKSSGWDGNSCVPVYKSVPNSFCNNSCSGDSAQSGETVKLVNCLDARDDTSREECKAENSRIIQSGREVEAASRIKASLSLENCSALEGEVKEACENKNIETQFLAKVLDSVQLENCTGKNDQEKAACDARNAQAIRQGQARLNLGVEDCSGLTGDQKTNCEFTNYQRDQLAQAAGSFVPDDCSKYQNDAEVLACNQNNQTRYSQLVNNYSSFVGLAELGASCVYTEACEGGAQKACAGKVANDNGAPVCRYDPNAASCSACTTSPINLRTTENKCSDDGQTCLNGPGYYCRVDADCQKATQVAQQAAANAPIDPAKYFSQQFEEGVACKQVQACEDGQEQVCEGKGANGVCDLSQGGGICSPCQAKGTVTLNRVATCNPETYKCEGAPALSGCSNDDQCKPVVTNVTSRAPVGAGQVVGSNGNIFDSRTVCQTEVVEIRDFVGNLERDYGLAGDIDGAAYGYNIRRENVEKCYQKYVDTGRAATVTTQVVTQNTEYYYAQRDAADATNRLDQFQASVSRGAEMGPSDSIDVVLQYQAEQQKALERLKLAEGALGLVPTASSALDRSTVNAQVDAYTKINQIRSTEIEIARDLAETTAARNEFNQVSIGSTADSEAVAIRYDEFEKARAEAQEKINQLAVLRGESGKGVSQQYQNQLDLLPTRADEQFQDNQTERQATQLANLARSSKSPEVISSAEEAITTRAQNAEARGKTELAAGIKQQGIQAAYTGWSNIYADELLKPGGDSEKGGTYQSQEQIQRLIAETKAVDPQAAQRMENEYEALPSYVQAVRLAEEIKRETVGTFIGTDTQDNNSAFYSVIANAEEQAKSRDDLANLIDRTCSLSEQRCNALRTGFAVDDPLSIPDMVVNTSLSSGSKAANLISEHRDLMPQLYALERAGETSNPDEAARIVGRAAQIASELDQIDPNIGANLRAQTRETSAQGQSQNEVDFAANTYANNKSLMLALNTAKNNGVEEIAIGITPEDQIAAAQGRMQLAIEQMREVNPAKADAMQSDLALTNFKIDSLPRGSELGNTDGCIVESCNGNSSSAQNICSGQLASASKTYNPFCASQNGVIDPATAWRLNQEAHRADVASAQVLIAGVQTSDDSPTFGEAIAATVNAVPGIWEAAKSIPSSAGEFISDWFARDIESHTPAFLGDAEKQNSCRANTTIIPFFGGGTMPPDCQIDNRTQEEKNRLAAEVTQNGGRIADILETVSGAKATSSVNQRTIQKIADETGVDLSVPVMYWTDTQKSKFNEKLKGYYGGALIDTFDSVVFPSTARGEYLAASSQCEKEWGKELCGVDPYNPSTFTSLAQGDEEKYRQTLASARALTPAVGDVPQSDFNWVLQKITGANETRGVDLLSPSTNTLSRDQFESDEEYYDAINAAGLSSAGRGKMTRDQLIDQLLLDANVSGLAPGGQPKTREEIASAVDAYLAIGYYGKNVVGASPAYTWQRSANNEYNLQTALTTVGLVTMAGPLEVLDPTGPAVQIVAKGIGNIFSPVVNVASRAVGGVAERVAVQGAEQAIRSSYGVSDTAGINAVRSYFDARVAGQTVDQAISTLTPVQQTAFTRATSEIAQTLGLTNTSDRIIASTVLDSVLTPQVVESASIAQRGSVLADLTLQAQSRGTLTREFFNQLASTPVRENGGRPLISAVEVDALADQGIFDTPALSPIQHQIAGRQAVESTLEAAGVLPSIQQAQVEQMIAGLKERVAVPVGPSEAAARPRIINGVGDGIRVGQATDGENAIISRLLAPDPVSRQDASGLAKTWNELPQQEKDLLIAQAAREAQIDRQAAVQFAQTPISGNQAFVQLGSQAEAFVSGVPVPSVTTAVTAAKNIIPQVEDAVIRAAQGQDLTPANESALRLAGVSEPGLRTVVGDMTDGQKAGLVRAIQSNPEILSSPDLESALARQGLTTEESQSVKLALQNLAPTPAAAGNTSPDDIFARISQAWDVWKADVPVSSNITEIADNQISPVVSQIDQPSPVVQLRDSVVNTPGCPVAGVFSQSTLAAASANSNVLGIELGRCPLERTLIDNPLLGRVIGWGDSAYDGAFSSGIRWADQILFNTSPAVEKMALKATQLTETVLEKSPIGNLIRASDTPNLTDEGDYFIYLTKNGAPTLDKPSAESVPILVRVSPSGNGNSVVSEVVLPRSLETNPQALIAVEKMTGQTVPPSLVTSNEDQLLSQLADASAYKYFPVNTLEGGGLTAQVNDRLVSAREWIDQNILRTDPDVDTPSLSSVDNGNPCPIGFSGTTLALDEVDPNSNVLAARSTCPDPIQRQRASDALGKVVNQFNDPSVRGTPGKGVTADIFRRRGIDYGVRPEFSPRAGARKSKYIFEVTSPDQLRPNGLYNYVLTDDGRIFVSDRRALRNEEGIKHIQIAGEVWQVGQNGVAARPDIGIIRSGEIVVDPYGRLLIDLESGTFSDYGKQIGWKTTPSNFSDLEDIFEGRLGVRPLAVSRATSPSRVSIMEAEARAATVFGMRDQVRVNNLNTALFNATNELNQIRAKIGNPDLLSETIGHARAARQRALDAIDAASTTAEKKAAADVMQSSISLNEQIHKTVLARVEAAGKELADLDKAVRDLHSGIKNNPAASDVAARLTELEVTVQRARAHIASAERAASEAEELAKVANYDSKIQQSAVNARKVAGDAQKSADQAEALFNESKKLADEAAAATPPSSAAGAAPGAASAPPPPPGMVDDLTKQYEDVKKASLDAYIAAQAGNAEDAIAAAEKAKTLLDQIRRTAGSNTSAEVADLLKKAENQLNAAIGQAKQAAKAQADQIEAGAKAAQSTSADGVKKANQAAEDARNGSIAASRKQAKEAADQAASARKTQVEAEAKAANLESGAAKSSNPDIKAEAARARQAANEAKKAADEVEAAAKNAEKAVAEAIEKLARDTQAELDGMAGKNFYEILGVPNTATKDEIRTAYRNAAKKYHPDNNPTPQAAEAFKKVDAAYKVLGNDRDRKTYDILGHQRYTNPGGTPPGGAGSAGRPPGGGSTPPGGAGSTPPGGSAGTPPGSAGSAGTPPGGAGGSAGTPPGSAGSAGTPPGASAGTPPGAGASAGTPPGAGAAGAAGTRTGTGTVEDVLNEMLAQDLYARLGINKSASKRDIFNAYRKLVKEFHPDVNKDPNAADVFKLIQEAYEILKDPTTRANYNSGRYRPRGGWAADGIKNRRASARAGAAGAAGTPPGSAGTPPGGAGSAGSAGTPPGGAGSTPPGGSAGTPPGAGASGGASGGASAGTPPGGAGATPPGGGAGGGASAGTPPGGSAGTPPGSAGSAGTPPGGSGFTPPGSAGTPPGAGASAGSSAASSATVKPSMRVNQAVAVGMVGGLSGGLVLTGTCIVYDFPFCFGAFSHLSTPAGPSAGTTPVSTTTPGGLIAPTVVPTTAVTPTTAVPTAVTPPTVVPAPPTVPTVGAPTGRSGSGDEGAAAPITPTDNSGRSGSGDEGAIAPVQPQTTTPVVKPGNQIGQNLAPGTPIVPTNPQSPGEAPTTAGSGATATSPVNTVNPAVTTPATSQSQTTASTTGSTPQNPPVGSTTNVPASPVSPIQAAGVLTPVNPSPSGIQPIPVIAVPEAVPSVVRAVAAGPVAVVNNLIATINQLIAPGVTPATIPATPPAIAPLTVIYDGPGCWGTHSVIMKLYSNGSEQYLRDYGVIPGECGNPAPSVCGAQPIVMQCGGDIGLDDKDPSHIYEVTPTYNCETQQISYQEVDKGVSQQCQNSGLNSKNKKIGESCQVNEQCQTGLTCDLLYTQTCVQKVSKIEVNEDTSKECDKIQTGDIACYKEEGVYKGHQVKISREKKGNSGCSVAIIDYGPGKCQ